MTAGGLAADRTVKRRGAGLVGEDRQKILPRLFAASCEDGLAHDADCELQAAWACKVGLSACDASAALLQSQGLPPSGAQIRRRGSRHLGLRASAPQSSTTLRLEDVDREPAVASNASERVQDRSLVASGGKGRKTVNSQSSPNLVPIAVASRPSSRAELSSGGCFFPGAEKGAAEAPPSSRSSLHSRGSLQSAARPSGGREARRRPPYSGLGHASLAHAGRQRLGCAAALGPSLPVAAVRRPDVALQGKSLSHSPSPRSPPEQQCSIDDETSVPKGLFDELLKLGKEAKTRGQHYLDKKRSSHPHLVNNDQSLRGMLPQRDHREIPSLPQRDARSTPCGWTSSGGRRTRTPQV